MSLINKHNSDNTLQKPTNSKKLVMIKAKYIGGDDNFTKPIVGIINFYEELITFTILMSPKIKISADSIKKISIEGKDEVTRRVTVTRLLAVGLFAFALKKKSNEQESYLIIETKDDREIIFFVDKISPINLKLKLQKATALLK